MKKSLSLLLSGAMVMGSFASVAFAADTTTTAPTTTAAPTAPATPPTTQQMYDDLAGKGVFQGVNANGDAGLDLKMTRAQFARTASLVRGLGGIGNPDTLVVTSAPFKDVPVGKWFTEEVQAVKAAGIMVGNANGTFNPNGNITVQELAVVSAQLLGLKAVDGSTVTGAASWAAGYIKALTDNGVSFPTNYKETATRAQLVGVAYQAYNAIQAAKLQPVSAKVIDANNVEVTFTDKLVEKVVLKDALVANKETEITVTHLGKDYKYKVTYVVTSATKVESVSASNLKEVVVKFDGDVDPTTAGDEGNYSITGKTVASAAVAADKKSVTLTVQGTATGTGTTDVLQNQVEYKLSLNNVRAGTKVISVTDFKFTPVDASLPVAQSAQALGNQTVKIAFSEPVQSVSAANFKIDGVPVVGYTTTSGNTVILKVYTALTNAEHTVTVSGVSDYSMLKSLSTDLKFTVTEDKTAPTIKAVVSASFEKVQLQFSEPVDPATVVGSNVYWFSGTSKQYAGSNPTQISDDTYEFDFTGNRLLYATDVYVTGVKDYSGNVIADNTKVNVTPTLDQTRPEVVNATLDATNKVITVKFSKALLLADAQAAANYVITDKDGNVVSKLKYPVLQADQKTVQVTLASALTQGVTYTLTVSGVSDATTLHNVMLPYSKTLAIADTTGPDSTAITASTVTDGGVNRVVVTFPKVMSVTGDGSVVDPGKYFYETTAAPTVWVALPTGTGLNITPDGKSVILSFPSDVAVGTVKNLRVQLVKDSVGNYISGLVVDILSLQPANVSNLASASATANNKISVLFSGNLLANTVNPSDFVVKTTLHTLTVIGAQLDAYNAKKVNLTLADATKLSDDGSYLTDVGGVTVDVKSTATTSTPEGKTVHSAVAAPVLDKIAASVASITGSADGKSLKVNFNEVLASTSDPVLLTNYATDLVVTDENGGVLQPGSQLDATHYTVDTVALNATSLTIKLGAAHTGVMSVAIANPRFITDASSSPNIVASQTAIDVAPVDSALAAAAAVAADKAATNVTFAGTETATTVKNNVTLVAPATNGSAVTWTSTNTAVSALGVVTRPIFSAGDATGSLTASFVKGTATDTRAFPLTVLKKDFTAVAAATPDATFTVTGDGYTAGTGNNIDVTAVGGTGIATINGVTFAVTVDATGKFTVAATGTWTATQAADATKTITVTKDGKVVTLHLSIVAGAAAGAPAFTVIN